MWRVALGLQSEYPEGLAATSKGGDMNSMSRSGAEPYDAL